MKYGFLLLALVVACSKPIGSTHKPVAVPNQVMNPIFPLDEIADPLVTPDQQVQTDEEFSLNRTYNGLNVVLNYGSRSHLGMIRVKGEDAEKLNKYMALKPIKTDAQIVKNELEAKVGKHIMCRADACWIYIDYKNGEVKENKFVSEAAKAPKIIFPYKGKNAELHMIHRRGRIFFDGMDAKALYSVMAMAELEAGGRKGSAATKKVGMGLECVKAPALQSEEKESYQCEVEFNHRSGVLKDDLE